MGGHSLYAALYVGVIVAAGCNDATTSGQATSATTASQTGPSASAGASTPDAAVGKTAKTDAGVPGTLGLSVDDFKARWNEAVEARGTPWTKLKLDAGAPGPVADSTLFAFPNNTELVLATNPADQSVRWAKILSNDDSLYEKDDSAFNARFLAWKLLLTTVKPDMNGAIQKDLAEQVLGVVKGGLSPRRAATGASTRYGFKFERGAEGARKRIWVRDAKDSG